MIKLLNKIIQCPTCGVDCHYVAPSAMHMPFSYPGWYKPHQHNGLKCLENQVKRLQIEKCETRDYFETGIRCDVIRAGLDPRGTVGLAQVHLLVEKIQELQEKKKKQIGWYNPNSKRFCYLDEQWKVGKTYQIPVFVEETNE